MGDARFADGFDEPERVAFGLNPAQLTVVVIGGLALNALAHSNWPMPIIVGTGALLLLATISLGWARLAGRPLLDWAALMAAFLWRRRPRRTTVPPGRFVAAPSIPSRGLPVAKPLRAAAAAVVGQDTDSVAMGSTPEYPAAAAASAWSQWLEDRLTAPLPDAPPRVSPPRTAAVRPVVEPAPPETLAKVQADRSSSEVEIRRTPLVLLPEPPDARGRHRAASVELDYAEDETDTDQPDTEQLDAEQLDAVVVPLPTRPDRNALSGPQAESATIPPLREESPKPLNVRALAFAGGPRRVVFFSLNGGSGRTTLATEVACALAERGRYHDVRDDQSRPLRVALLDLDMRSPTVAVRVGVPAPTVWDYALGGNGDPGRLDEFMVRHRSGAAVLLGPPKPAAPETTPITVDLATGILDRLEADGTQFIVIDVAADLGPISRWALGAAHDIFIVITPTASGIQDAYRTTEALRRLNHRHKLAYVVNRARGKVDLSDTMADLGGRVVAEIPYDARVEEAENAHRCVASAGGGSAAAAIVGLAAHLYPGLTEARHRPRIGFAKRRRRA